MNDDRRPPKSSTDPSEPEPSNAGSTRSSDPATSRPTPSRSPGPPRREQDRPHRNHDDRPPGNRPPRYKDDRSRSGKPSTARDDRPPRRDDDRFRGDKPFRSRDDRPGGGKPYRSRDDRPPRRDDDRSRGDRPFRSRDDRPGGGKPYRSRDDRPPRRDDDRSRGDKPFRSRDDRPPRRDDDRSRGDKPFRSRDDRPRGDKPSGPRSGGPSRGPGGPSRGGAGRGFSNDRDSRGRDDRGREDRGRGGRGPGRGDRFDEGRPPRGDRSGKPGGWRDDRPRGDRGDRRERTDRRDRRDDGPRREKRPPTGPSGKPLRKRPRVALPVKGRRPETPAWIGRLDHPFTVDADRVRELIDLLDTNLDPAPFTRHLEIVRDINAEVNLVSRANVDAVLLQSLWESLAPLRDDSWRRGPRVLDLGTGGGFPGMTLAIGDPTLSLTLLDSRRAKTLSLLRMIDELGLDNVSVVHDRAETHVERISAPYDSITAKAVSTLPELARWCEGLLRPGGTLLSWKGPEAEKEMHGIEDERWKLLHALPVLPHRYVVVLQFGDAPEEATDSGDTQPSGPAPASA